ncbi:MAG: hypothetical protein K1X64_10360 [Myxococcaceae bacterium]|nr:hypothetical protein [Myxococcaceae bacterium]
MAGVIATLLCSAPVHAEVLLPEREVETVRANYNASNYPECLKRAQEALRSNNLSDEQRVEIAKYAGLSASNLGDKALAEKYFLQLLQLNPDYVLDPFAVAPPVIKDFEDLRKKNGDALSLVRKQLALKAAEAQREAEKKKAEEKKRAEEELNRLRVAATEVTVRTVEQRSFLVNFVPFGAGQFQQRRYGWGVAFASAEGALAITSIVAFFAIESMFESQTVTLTNRFTADGTFGFEVRRIPKERQAEAKAWNVVKWSAGFAALAVGVAGIVDALVHHQDEVITVTREKPSFSAATPDLANPGLTGRATQSSAPAAQLLLFPTTGGIGAGVTIDF